jgi:hypothetical protein
MLFSAVEPRGNLAIVSRILNRWSPAAEYIGQQSL